MSVHAPAFAAHAEQIAQIVHCTMDPELIMGDPEVNREIQLAFASRSMAVGELFVTEWVGTEWDGTQFIARVWADATVATPDEARSDEPDVEVRWPIPEEAVLALLEEHVDAETLADWNRQEF